MRKKGDVSSWRTNHKSITKKTALGLHNSTIVRKRDHLVNNRKQEFGNDAKGQCPPPLAFGVLTDEALTLPQTFSPAANYMTTLTLPKTFSPVANYVTTLTLPQTFSPVANYMTLTATAVQSCSQLREHDKCCWQTQEVAMASNRRGMQRPQVLNAVRWEERKKKDRNILSLSNCSQCFGVILQLVCSPHSAVWANRRQQLGRVY